MNKYVKFWILNGIALILVVWEICLLHIFLGDTPLSWALGITGAVSVAIFFIVNIIWVEGLECRNT